MRVEHSSNGAQSGRLISMPFKWMNSGTAIAVWCTNGEGPPIALTREAHFIRSKTLEDSLAQLNTEHVEILVSRNDY